MTRKLVTIRNIDNVSPHPNADRLEIIQIGGWQVVSGKGNFKPGDLGVYFEIDSFVPVDKEPFTFLEKNKITWNGIEGARIKTIRLRGELSQGLLLPVDDLFKGLNPKASVDGELIDYAEFLGVTKWEVVIPAQLAGQMKGGFPSFIPKTDQERIQNLWNVIRGVEKKQPYVNPTTGEIYYPKPKYDVLPTDAYEVTVKLDGSSMTAYYNNGEFGVCSRNMELKDEQSDLKNDAWRTVQNSFWMAAKKYDIESKLRDFGYNIALQGELIGPGIQGNNEQLSEIEFYVYDVYLIDEGRYADAEYRRNLVRTLDLRNVPTQAQVKFPDEYDDVDIVYEVCDFDTITKAIEYATGPSLNPSVMREGLVWKNVRNPSFSFKIISNEYLEEHGDR